MKILQVSHRVPYPLNEGGTIGIYNYTRGFYEAGHEITLVALNGIKHQIDTREALKELRKFGRVFILDIDTNVKIVPAFLNLFSKRSYNVSRFYSAGFKDLLVNLLSTETFDIIQVEGTFVAEYFTEIRKLSKAPIVLRQHNVEYQIWERLAGNEPNPIKKWYLNLLSKRLKQFEQSIINLYDAVVPVTEDDAELFRKLGCTKPIFVSPSGIDTLYWKPTPALEDPFKVYHLGSLEWIPNREAVLWFIAEVWPLILGIDKRFTLYIAGKNMPDFMKNMHVENVKMIGEVKDGAEFVKDKMITVVPLLSGSGIRLKILEAMSAAKLVISTSIGAQGISYTANENIYIADTPQQFESIFRQFVLSPDKLSSVKEGGYQLIQSKYSNHAVVERLLTYYLELSKMGKNNHSAQTPS